MTTRTTAALAFACTAALVPASEGRAQEWGRPGPTRAPYTVETYTVETFDGSRHQAELLELVVPENRADSRRSITLSFVRLPSTASSPGPPIVFLMGGPGIPGSVIVRVPVYFRLLDRLRGLGDVIIPDQRGIGMSRPNLNCPDRRAFPPDAWTSRSRVVGVITARIATCAAHFRALGIDPAAYTTSASADDLDDLRLALGAPALDLLAFSYGTELALDYARRHPGHLRQLVLQGVRAPDRGALPSDADIMLERVALLARTDTVLAAEVPDLVGDVRRALARAEAGPLRITVEDSGRTEVVSVGRYGLQSLFESLYAGPDFPAMIHSMSQGDDTLFHHAVTSAWRGGVSFWLMAVAVNCGSRWSPGRMARVAAETPGSVFGEVRLMMTDRRICRAAGNPDLGEPFRQPVRTLARTLFVQGSLDTNTPIWQLEEIRAGFPNSTEVIVENGGHELLGTAEIQDVIVAFYSGAAVSSRIVTQPRPRLRSVAQAKAAIRQ